MILPLLLAAAASAAATPSPARLKADVETLVGFGTRHTLSTTTDPKRGIGAARDWAARQFETIGQGCDGCITVERINRRFTGPRAPNGVMVEDVLGIQRGRDPNRVVIVGAHIDSRVTDVMDATSDAPGANDDASGVALVLRRRVSCRSSIMTRPSSMRSFPARNRGCGAPPCSPTPPSSGTGASRRC
jgi:hypothetical protein